MRHQINFTVEALVYQRLSELAREASMPLATYAKVLFEAAYAARWHKSGDPELDAKVGCALVLHAAKKDSTTIAHAVGLHEATVVRIVDAWRTERPAP
jgi:hypothetical protein